MLGYRNKYFIMEKKRRVKGEDWDSVRQIGICNKDGREVDRKNDKCKRNRKEGVVSDEWIINGQVEKCPVNIKIERRY